MSLVNNDEQNKSILNAEKNKLEIKEIMEKDNKDSNYQEQKPNQREEEEKSALRESNIVKYSNENELSKLSDISKQNLNNFNQEKENDINKNLLESIKSIINLSKILSNLNEKKKLDIIK